MPDCLLFSASLTLFSGWKRRKLTSWSVFFFFKNCFSDAACPPCLSFGDLAKAETNSKFLCAFLQQAEELKLIHLPSAISSRLVCWGQDWFVCFQEYFWLFGLFLKMRNKITLETSNRPRVMGLAGFRKGPVSACIQKLIQRTRYPQLPGKPRRSPPAKLGTQSKSAEKGKKEERIVVLVQLFVLSLHGKEQTGLFHVSICIWFSSGTCPNPRRRVGLVSQVSWCDIFGLGVSW